MLINIGMLFNITLKSTCNDNWHRRHDIAEVDSEIIVYFRDSMKCKDLFIRESKY